MGPAEKNLRKLISDHSKLARLGLITVIVLFAFGLRVWGLHASSFSMDEIAELATAKQNLSGIINAPNGLPPLYHLLLAGWLSLFGTDQAARWLSVVLGALTIIPLWMFAKRIGSPAVGYASTFLLAISPFHIWYSQEARQHALLVFLATLALWFLCEALVSKRPAFWVLYGLTSLAGIYTHYYFAILTGAIVIILLVDDLRSANRKPIWSGNRKSILTAHAALALGAAPLLALIGSDLRNQAGVAIGTRFNLDVLGYVFFSFIAGPNVGPSTRELHSLSSAEAIREALPWAVLVALVLGALGYHGQTSLGRVWWRRLVLLTFCPVIIVGLLAQLFDVGFRVRYVIWAIIPFIVILGASLSRTRWQASIALLVLPILSLGSLNNRHYVDRYKNEDMRSLSAFLAEHATRETPIFVIPRYMTQSLVYYLGNEWKIHSVPDIGDLNGRAKGDLETSEQVKSALNVVEESIPQGSRYWLVYTRPFHGDPNGHFLRTLSTTHRIQLRAKFAGVVLYEGHSRSSPKASRSIAASRSS
jgi:mannosyltransferase